MARPAIRVLARAVACAVALGASAGAWAAPVNPSRAGYLTSPDTTVVRSGTGLCWQSGSDPTPDSLRQCLPPEAKVSVPVVAVPVPVPAPEPVAAVAPPLPVSVPEPAVTPAPLVPRAPPVVRLTLDADALFDFDKAALRPAGRLALDDFVGKIGGIKAEMISAIGYTDRFGTEAYNQGLSERRVEAVRVYLVSRGIGADQMRTEGRGKSQPITKPDQCQGARSAAVIACLQPDRRVELEVEGDVRVKAM